MNDIVFWLWAPMILVATALFGVILMWRDTKRQHDHRHHPAE